MPPPKVTNPTELAAEMHEIVKYLDSKKSITVTTGPARIHYYNIICHALSELKSHIAVMEDVAGIYMKKEK